MKKGGDIIVFEEYLYMINYSLLSQKYYHFHNYLVHLSFK